MGNQTQSSLEGVTPQSPTVEPEPAPEICSANLAEHLAYCDDDTVVVPIGWWWAICKAKLHPSSACGRYLARFSLALAHCVCVCPPEPLASFLCKGLCLS